MEKVANLKELLNLSAERYGEKIAYELENKTITYKRLLHNVNCLGTGLIDLGLKGKRIAIISENRYEWELSYLAVACGTGIVVPIDKALPKEEIDRIVKLADVDAIICSLETEEKVKDLDVKYIISMDLKKSDEKILSERDLYFKGKKLIELGNKSFIDSQILGEGIAFLYFSSGTTDESKAIMLSNKNVCSSLMFSADELGMNSNDRVLSVLSLNHVLEGLFSFLISIYNGATRIYCDDIKNIVQEIIDKKITFMCGVPSLYELMYNELLEDKKYEEINVNLFFSAGAPLNSKTKNNYSKIGINLIQGYGLTETSPIVSLENKKYQKPDSVGKVAPGVEVKLIDKKEDGSGELIVKGDNVMMGYYRNPELTRETIRDGWLYTGDIAKIDEDGYIFLCGRSKDLVVLQNGKKIFPDEIERKLNEKQGILESFVYGKETHCDIRLAAEIVYDTEYFKDKEENEISDVISKLINEVNDSLPEFKNITDLVLTDNRICRNQNGKIIRYKELEKIEALEKKEKQTSEENDETVEGRVKKVIKEVIERDSINLEDILSSDLGIDSLDKVEIIIKLQKEFGLKIPKEESSKFKKVNDIVEYLS